MRVLTAIVLASLAVAPAVAAPTPAELLRASEDALSASVHAPDKGIPKELLERAECIGVFPGVKKGAFVVGGEFGRGVFTCRRPSGELGAPAFFTLGGPSVGFQAGVQEADIILLIMNEGGVKHLLSDKFTLGGELSAVAGPVGRTAQASTDAQMHAQVLSWSRSRGAFLGASLEGIVVKPNPDATREFYGQPISAREILVSQSASVPEKAKSFVHSTNEYARRPS